MLTDPEYCHIELRVMRGKEVVLAANIGVSPGAGWVWHAARGQEIISGDNSLHNLILHTGVMHVPRGLDSVDKP